MTGDKLTGALPEGPASGPSAQHAGAAGDVPGQAATDGEVIAALRRENKGLREALESRAMIEQAKGMVMLCDGLSTHPAFRVLSRWSSLWNIKLRVVAATLVRVGMRAPLEDAGTVLTRELTSEVDDHRTDPQVEIVSFRPSENGRSRYFPLW